MSVSHSIPNSIPFLDLVTPHVELEQELTAVFHKALRTGGFIGGPMVEDFEKAFAAFCKDREDAASNHEIWRDLCGRRVRNPEGA